MKLSSRAFLVVSGCFALASSAAFAPPVAHQTRRQASTPRSSSKSDDNWAGEVVSNAAADGKMRGYSIQSASPADTAMPTDWILTIDGVQADLGRFSSAVYQKITREAKETQRFQGFRPGTIPPHLEPTYRAFAMDECARETVLEALQQHQIRPFDGTRTGMLLKDFSIPPPKVNKKKKKKKKKSKQKGNEAVTADLSVESNKDVDDDTVEDTAEPAWRQFDTMKEAIDAGWRPGQSFSFVAVDIKGQKVKDKTETPGATPLGKYF
jgi:hypothetical protein